MGIKNFDWSSIKKEDTILTVKGPFIWAKFNWYLGALRIPFMFLATLNNPIFFYDLLISGPLLYGGYHRKKWSYYTFLFLLTISSIFVFLNDPGSGVVAILIYTVPTFIYYMKRKRLFNIVDHASNDVLEKYKVEDKVKGVLLKTKGNSEKIIKDYKLKDKYDKVKKVTLEKSEKVIKDYELKDKYEDALGATKKTIGNFAKRVSNELDSDSTSDKLRELKSLLDDDLITQEDYDAKKKQLLDL